MIYKNVMLHNINDLIEIPEKKGVLLNRIPANVRNNINEGAVKLSYFPAGCEIRFQITEGIAEITLTTEAADYPNGTNKCTGVCEVYFGCFQYTHIHNPIFLGDNPVTIRVAKSNRFNHLERVYKEQGLPYDPSVVRIILPHNKQVVLCDVKGNVKPPELHQLPKKKLITYGSSITHGYNAAIPTVSYAMQLARHLEADLFNLGLAGNAKMDIALADYISGLDWDLALLELGVNVVFDWDGNKYRERVTEFVDKIVKSKPERYVFCVDLYTHITDIEKQDNPRLYREILGDIVKNLNNSGYGKVVHIRGDEIADKITILSADLVHPSTAGMTRMALNLAERISSKIIV